MILNSKDIREEKYSFKVRLSKVITNINELTQAELIAVFYLLISIFVCFNTDSLFYFSWRRNVSELDCINLFVVMVPLTGWIIHHVLRCKLHCFREMQTINVNLIYC